MQVHPKHVCASYCKDGVLVNGAHAGQLKALALSSLFSFSRSKNAQSLSLSLSTFLSHTYVVGPRPPALSAVAEGPA